jgi:hypothetical protein
MATKIQWFGHTKVRWFAIGKPTAYQTICQIVKLISNHISQTIYAPYHRYRGLSISFVYRRKMGGYIRDTKPFLLAIYNKPYMADIKV